MLERDYLLRLIAIFFKAVQQSLRMDKDADPLESAELLEAAIGESVDMDANVFLSLSPDSIATILDISGTDPRVTGYLARTMLLEASYLEKAARPELAELRRAQAHAIADAYGIEIPPQIPLDPTEEEMLEFYGVESFDTEA